jgi:hypothetical protein
MSLRVSAASEAISPFWAYVEIALQVETVKNTLSTSSQQQITLFQVEMIVVKNCHFDERVFCAKRNLQVDGVKTGRGL